MARKNIIDIADRCRLNAGDGDQTRIGGLTLTTEIQCSRCCGTGKVELSFTYNVTLEAIQKYGATGVTIEYLSKMLNCTYTAMCNRVKKLEQLNLVTIDRTKSRRIGVIAKES